MELRVVSLDHLVDWPDTQGRTGMVLVQPQIELELGQAGYRLKPHLCAAQLRAFRSALELARKPFCPEIDHSHFVIMPEYGLSSAAFEECEALVLELLPANAVCMAGLDAMKPDRWKALAAGSVGGSDLLFHAQACHYDWVNGAVIWVKDRHGRLHRFLQAKMRPNPQEQRAGSMYRGEQVLYMQAGPRTFCLLLCYDFIARIGTDDVATWLWQRLQLLAPPRALEPASRLLFVLQDNDRPDHSSFVDSARVALTKPGRRFETVLFVNRAGRSGQTCLFCSKADWPPTRPDTLPDDIPRLYRREQVGDSELTRLAMRAGHPAIHRMLYAPKWSMERHAGAPREPIDFAGLYPLSQGRVLGEGLSLHASQHVVAEVVSGAAPGVGRPHPLTHCQTLLARLEEAYRTVAAELDALPLGRLHDVLDHLLHGSVRVNPDFWEEYPERRAIRWMVESLYILIAGGVSARLSHGLLPHITADCGDFTLTVLAGDGQTRPEYLFGGLLDRCYDRRPHLFLLLDHQGAGSIHAMRIDEREARRGAGGVWQPVPLDDGPFGRQADEERLDAPPLYWCDRRALLEALWQAPDPSAFLQMLMGVFPWRAA